MGKYKRRTEFINSSLLTAKDDETKRLLSVGFIPEHLKADYDKFMSDIKFG